MNDSKISVRYAKAIFLAAIEADLLEKVNEDISLLSISIKMKSFVEILESPVVKTSEKISLIEKVFVKHIQKLSFDFLILILKNRRENYIKGMIRNFTKLYKDYKGIKSAELIVPEKVSEQHKKQFNELLKKVYNSKIALTDKINTDLIGGFILKVEDEQFDASVSSSLARIRKKLLETSIEK